MKRSDRRERKGRERRVELGTNNLLVRLIAI